MKYAWRVGGGGIDGDRVTLFNDLNGAFDADFLQHLGKQYFIHETIGINIDIKIARQKAETVIFCRIKILQWFYRKNYN